MRCTLRRLNPSQGDSADASDVPLYQRDRKFSLNPSQGDSADASQPDVDLLMGNHPPQSLSG